MCCVDRLKPQSLAAFHPTSILEIPKGLLWVGAGLLAEVNIRVRRHAAKVQKPTLALKSCNTIKNGEPLVLARR